MLTAEKILLFQMFLSLAMSIGFGQAKEGEKGGDVFILCQVLDVIFTKSPYCTFSLSDNEMEVQVGLMLSELPVLTQPGSNRAEI